jgi:hypothetical protein
MLDQYLACVAAQCWGRVVFKMLGRQECFVFSCQPSTPPWTSPSHCVRQPRAACTLPPNRSAAASPMRTSESKRKKGGSPGPRGQNTLQSHRQPCLSSFGRKSSSSFHSSCSCSNGNGSQEEGAATVTKVAAAPQAAVATYCEVTMAMLPTAAAPQAAAEAAAATTRVCMPQLRRMWSLR